MTTKKTTFNQAKPTDALTTDKATFTAKLLERIEIGNELVNRQVTNVDELEKNEKDYYKWNSYNSEYLKNSLSHNYSCIDCPRC